MTVLSVMQSAALRLIGRKPTVFFGAPGAFEQELCDWVNEVAVDIVSYQDWQALQSVATITGDGILSEFALPADYARMMLSSAVDDLSGWFWGYASFDDLNQFLRAETFGFNPWPGGWILSGGKLKFSPVPTVGQTATFPYISKNYARDSDAAPKAQFDADTDSFALDDRLLTLGLAWRWRENKKLDASGDQEAFIKALDEYGAKDKGAKPIRRRQARWLSGTRPGWPWELG